MKENSKKIGAWGIIWRTLLIIFLVLLFVVCGYVGYFTLSFTRAGNMALSTHNKSSFTEVNIYSEYSLMSWNIGFGAYSDDFSFFMDGGKNGRAFSQKAVEDNMKGICETSKNGHATESKKSFDFLCYQEVDTDGTRSYHVDERKLLCDNLPGFSYTFAHSYSSPYIVIPFGNAHGANKSVMLTMSRYPVFTAKRVELPIENGFGKYFDLDRCYSVNRFEVSNGKYLVLINLHLSAYSKDGIAKEQLKMVIDECKKELSVGNYVICCGDFNHDLLGNSQEIFGVKGDYSWTQPVDATIFDGSGMRLVVPFDKDNPIPSCRNANMPYGENNFVVTVDGFIVSSNIKVTKSGVIDLKFKNSDHNPVFMNFEFVND